MARVIILDYGAGNILSIKNALERQGAQVSVAASLDAECDGIILPGVGHFDPAMRGFPKERLCELVQKDTPVLGICLGMEMFFERSEEGKEAGLGLLKGGIISLPDSIKVPHMGWNNLEISRPGILLEGVKDGAWAYFVHSYMAEPADPDVITAQSDYGMGIPAVLERGCIFGTQFHPEKSGSAGRTMIANFLRECTK